jgi:1,4-alpha-glucan branching enzyme
MMARKKSKRLESEIRALRRVDFTLLAPEAKSVSLAGDFNGWDVNSLLLKENTKGMWKISIDLMPGRYEYLFLVDGEWRNDPNSTSLAPNPFGGENCVLMLE